MVTSFVFDGGWSMDCYFHANVPSVARCVGCAHPICATCRDETATCPGCRLAARIDAAAAANGELPGGVGRPRSAPPPPYGQAQGAAATATLAVPSPETRALVALGYPLWPLAALALLDPKRSPYVRRQALQALGLNFGLFGLWLILSGIAQIPFLGISAIPILAVLAPVWLVASVLYGVKVWHGDEVRVPLVSDWLDEHVPDDRTRTA
jgi:uncharacterized membrane protein